MIKYDDKKNPYYTKKNKCNNTCVEQRYYDSAYQIYRKAYEQALKDVAAEKPFCYVGAMEELGEETTRCDGISECCDGCARQYID